MSQEKRDSLTLAFGFKNSTAQIQKVGSKWIHASLESIHVKKSGGFLRSKHCEVASEDDKETSTTLRCTDASL